jgi:molybdopterin-guanine dinucleotide biosynthesis protein A
MLTIAIQAGGGSRRTGGDKALLPLAGKSLIEHVLMRIDGLGDDILITTNRPEDHTSLGIRLVSDPVPGLGTLNGLHTALAAARERSVLVLACDMPFVSRPLLEHLVGLASQADVVVPYHEDGLEPLHAIYNKQACLPAIEAALAAGEKRLVSFYPMVRVLPVEESDLARLDPRGLSFFNVNTLDDLAQAERILSEGKNKQV